MLLKIRQESSAMFLGDIPTLKHHGDWLDRKLLDDNCKFFVIDFEEPIGYIRCERIENGFELSYGLLKEYHGLGFGSYMVKYVCNMLRGRIIARIKAHNIASIKVVQNNQFKLKKVDGEILVFERIVA